MTTDERADADLVREALLDRQAFAAIVDRYEVALRRYLARLGLSAREDVNDVLQEAFIKIYINLNDFDTALSLSAWIYRIAHNEAISHFRRRNARPKAVSFDEEFGISELVRDVADTEMEASQRITSKAVHQALLELSPHYREVLVLRFLEEKTYDEIADILEIPNGTVATYLNRGKRDLRLVLKKFYDQSV